MVTLASSSGKATYGIREYYLDTPSDLTDLMEVNIDSPGSVATIISTGEKYIQNGQGQWILQPAAAGGSGGSGGGTGTPGVSIVGVTVNAQNHLICTMSNGSTIDAGEITVQPGISIKLVAINSSNHLIVTLSDNSTIDAGLIKTIGVKSVKVDSDNHLQVTLTDNSIVDAGEITTLTGDQGVSVTSIKIDGNTQHLICTLSDGTIIDAGEVPAGQDGAPGQDGKNGVDGLPGRDGTDGEPGKDGISISNIVIDKDQHLICILSDGTTIDAGELPIAENEEVYIVDLAINEDNYLIANMSDGHQKLVGKLTGDGGIQITCVTKVEIDEDNHIQVSYSDGTKEDIGEIAVDIDIGVKSLALNDNNEIVATMNDDSEVVIAEIPQVPNSVIAIALDDDKNLKITFVDDTEEIINVERIVSLSESDDEHIVATMADGTKVKTEILAGNLKTIKVVKIDEGNILKVEYRDGTEEIVGVLAATAEITDIQLNDENQLVFTMSDGSILTTEKPIEGKQGKDGSNVVAMRLDENRHLISTLSNGIEIDAGEVNIDGLTLEEIKVIDVALKTDTITFDGTTTQFVLPVESKTLTVYVNGLCLEENLDYTITDGVITFNDIFNEIDRCTLRWLDENSADSSETLWATKEDIDKLFGESSGDGETNNSLWATPADIDKFFE